jgi:hypothetical protein
MKIFGIILFIIKKEFPGIFQKVELQVALFAGKPFSQQAMAKIILLLLPKNNITYR